MFIEEGGEVREAMRDVARITMHDRDAVCIDIVGRQLILEGVDLKEANLLGHGLVFRKA